MRKPTTCRYTCTWRSSRLRWKRAWASMASGLSSCCISTAFWIPTSPASMRFTSRRKRPFTLGKAKARVCACPTSERNLGDGAVPADRLFAAGAGICFGSDSNVQIDLLEDARLLEYHLRMNKLERVVLAAESEKDALARRLFPERDGNGRRKFGRAGWKLGSGPRGRFLHCGSG